MYQINYPLNSIVLLCVTIVRKALVWLICIQMVLNVVHNNNRVLFYSPFELEKNTVQENLEFLNFSKLQLPKTKGCVIVVEVNNNIK